MSEIDKLHTHRSKPHNTSNRSSRRQSAYSKSQNRSIVSSGSIELSNNNSEPENFLISDFLKKKLKKHDTEHNTKDKHFMVCS